MLPVLLISLLFLFSLTLTHTSSAAAPSCNQTCGSVRVPYPFGFSSGCQIPLNCTAATKIDAPNIRIGEFQVKNITSISILIDVPPSCNRSIQEASVLFSRNYAITTNTTLLVRSCPSNISSGCMIPTAIMSRWFDIRSCNPKTDNLSCLYIDDSNNSLLIPKPVTDNKCMLFSSMAYRSENTSFPSFDVRIVELGWWLEGGCELCSENSTCNRIENRGITCKCNEGFSGDGFSAGEPCWKVAAVSSRCNPSKYMSRDCGFNSRVSLLIGGIIAGAVIMAGLAFLCYFIRRRTNLLRIKKSTRRLLSEASCTVPLYNYKDIEKATDGFSNTKRLGTGAYGTVYVGKLHNGDLVAVKKLRNHDTDSMEQVMNEIKLLSSVSHPNLVRLLGCCIEREEQVLVYEFMPNGTLSQHLQRERGRGLPWTVRLNIATETAKAIAHLHSSTYPPIYHRDIKSSNILLDYNFNSKVADFGLSRMINTESSHISTAPQGTPGYVDPQYHQNFHLSDKSDVYSFGVVLVEIITALKVVDFNRGQSEVNLAALAISKIGKGCVEDIIDPYLEPHRDAWTLSSTHKMAELAFRCLAFHRDMRPSMMEVADELEQIRLSGWAPSDENMLLSAAASVSSSPSNLTDKSRGTVKSRRLVCISSMEELKGDSPISVQEPWCSEQSSPSANSLLGNVVR